MNALRGFIVKEIHHILRDRQTLMILLLLPLAQVILFGYALRTDVRGIRLVMVDPAPDPASLELRSRFTATGIFEVVAALPNTDALPGYFQRGAADQALVLEPDLGDGGSVMIITDATDPNTGSTMQAYATAVIRGYEHEIAGPGGGGIRIIPHARMRFNPTLESVNLFVPGLIALVLTVVSALMSAISLSREKERGTLEVLLVSPLRPWQIIVGKVVPYLVLGFANVLSVLAAAWLLFGVPFEGSVLLLLLESLLFIVTSLALGVLIAARTSSQRTAMMGALMGLMLPTTILSGMIFPIASMPAWLQLVTNIVPAKWFILISRGIMLKGVGLAHLWPETLILVGMTTLVLVAAVRSFDIRLS
ncbi:MAG TPA: ABC transporter permease [Longimicrobiaceae bacterium]|nr:ABC transporter permease [Longimicrobiaceae bacterium]